MSTSSFLTVNHYVAANALTVNLGIPFSRPQIGLFNISIVSNSHPVDIKNEPRESSQRRSRYTPMTGKRKVTELLREIFFR